MQDGTRLEEADREKLNISHKNEFEKQGIVYHIISGNWEQRFNQAVKITDQAFFEEII